MSRFPSFFRSVEQCICWYPVWKICLHALTVGFDCFYPKKKDWRPRFNITKAESPTSIAADSKAPQVSVAITLRQSDPALSPVETRFRNISYCDSNPSLPQELATSTSMLYRILSMFGTPLTPQLFWREEGNNRVSFSPFQFASLGK